jgi:hypothetical protein
MGVADAEESALHLDRQVERGPGAELARVSRCLGGLFTYHFVKGGLGLMGLGVGILLVAVGAILSFAVNVHTSGAGVNLHTIGLILLAVGVIGSLVSMMFWSSWGGFGGGRRTTVAPGGTTTTTTVDQP